MSELLETSVLDVLCPMHMVLSHTGHIAHAGPTIEKMSGDVSLVGQRFFEVFEVRRPRTLNRMADLQKTTNRKLHLKLRAPPHTRLKGIAVPTDADTGQLIVNLSFGIAIVDGVRDFALTNADFAATDLAIEMLYLIEAKTAAMEASHRLNARLQLAKSSAEEQAFTDTLTGLKNRRALSATLGRLVQSDDKFAVMQIDLDYFKDVNDTLGHAAGDYVLQKVAKIMVDETRSQDVVARVGGDEFTVVLPKVDSEEVLRRIGRRLINRLEEPVMFEGNECRISASIGTVWVGDGAASSIDELLSDADVALYASKNAGRATQTLYRPALREAANAPAPPGAGQRRRATD